MRRSRLDALDGLRGVAAAGIVVLHVWMFDRGDEGSQAKGVSDFLLGELRLGVPLFFVLSGFLLHRGWVRAALDGVPGPRPAAYALRRLARVAPAYWVTMAGSFVVLSAVDHPLAPSAGQLPIFAVFAQDYVGATLGRLDPPMWSLGVEVAFYAALPAIGLLALRLGPRRGAQLGLCGALIAVGVACCTMAAHRHWPATLTTTLLIYLPCFAAGMGAAVLVHGRRLSRARGAALVAAGVVLVIADGAWHAGRLGPLRYELRDLPAAVGFALVIAGLAAAPLRAAALTCTPARALGTISYGVYLWHFPVILWLRSQQEWPADGLHAMARTAVLTLILAAASWWLVERPVIGWAAARTKGARRRPARRPQRAGLPAYAER
jgi:peptidoglycan/LPS O-acetylase OafA/YrhL